MAESRTKLVSILSFSLFLNFVLVITVVVWAGEDEGTRSAGDRGKITERQARRIEEAEAKTAACRERLDKCILKIEKTPSYKRPASSSPPIAGDSLSKTAALFSAVRTQAPVATARDEKVIKKLIQPVDQQTQDQILCEIARKIASDDWRSKRDSITEGLKSSLQDPDVQERDLQSEVDKFATLLDLDGNEREELAGAYREIRSSRMEAIREAVSKDPPDYREVLRQAKGLFRAEDDLIGDRYGTKARELLRFSELETRTVILAIAAAISGMGVENAVGW